MRLSDTFSPWGCCPVCDRQVALLSDGVVRWHVTDGRDCAGWGLLPGARLVEDLLRERFGENA